MPGHRPQKNPKKRRSTKKDIIIENSLVQQLEDRNSSIYEHVFKLLKNKKFKLSKEQAGVEIEKFIDKVNEAHNNKTSVKLMFEKGSIFYAVMPLTYLCP